MESMLKEDYLVAIGEAGLDYSHKNHTSALVQEIVFVKQMQMANRHELPVVIHFRESYERGLDLMKNTLNRNTPLHIHCFTENWKTAEDIMQSFPSAYFGFTGVITYNSADYIRSVVRKLPIERCLIETDGPFFNVTRSRAIALPQDIPIIGAKIGELKNKSLDFVLESNISNSKRVYTKFFKK